MAPSEEVTTIRFPNYQKDCRIKLPHSISNSGSHIIISLRDFSELVNVLFFLVVEPLKFYIDKMGFCTGFLLSRKKVVLDQCQYSKQRDIQLYFNSHGNSFIFLELKLLEYSAIYWTFILDFRLHDKLPTY